MTPARRRPHRARSDSGATLVEFALVLPLLVLLLFGTFDTGQVFYRQLALRNGTQSAARQVSVASFGGVTSCTMTPTPADTKTQQVMCLAKARIGLPEADVRVKFALGGGGFAKGQPMAVCTEYRQTSVSGVLGPFINGRIAKSISAFRVEVNDASPVITAAAETSLSGSWSWCTT